MPEINIMHQITANDQGSIKDVSQRSNVYLSLEEKKIYFDLKLVDVTPGNDPGVAERDDVRTIMPGRSYQIWVSATRNGDFGQYRYGGSQNYIVVESDIELQVRFRASQEMEIDKLLHIDKKLFMKKENAVGFKDRFEFTLYRDCPVGDVDFLLLYNETDGAEKLATTLKIELDGTYFPFQGLVNEKVIQINKTFPDHVAMLFVGQPDANTLYFTGRNRRCKPLTFDAKGWEPLTVVDLEGKPREARSRVGNKTLHAKAISELLNWFRKLLKQYDEQLCIVIVDEHDLAIPWEIFALDYKDYLGARATIVRWKPIDGRPLDMSEVLQEGSAIAYLDHEVALPDAAYFEHSDLEEFNTHLLNLKALQSIGLIYLGCYSHESMDSDSWRKLTEHLTNLEFEFLEKHDDPRPIIFVNAFDSANPKCYGGQFVEVLLSRLVSSYIGILGPIGPTYAYKVAKRIFQEANSKSQGVQVAKMLRDLRAEAVKEMWEKHIVHEDFISAFMYVYYGNPLMSLRLAGLREVEAHL